MLREFYLDPARSLIPAAVQLADVLYMNAVQGHDADGRLPEGGFAPQCRQALRNVETLLRQAGAGLDDVAYVGVYFRDAALRPVLNGVWIEFYPDAERRPPHVYVPSALPPGVDAQLEVIALPGAARTTLEIPGLKHQDPMAMGDRIGGLVFSSRLFGLEAFTGRAAQNPDEQAAMVLQHARTLMEQGGGDVTGIRQVTAFVTEPSLAAALPAAWGAT
jgi:2-iminobutanoate/2-iminopropanoate deaminase